MRQLARMLAADTSLTKGGKVALARTLAGAPLPRLEKPAEMPDWLAGHIAACDDVRAQQVTRLQWRRYVGLMLMVALVWAVMNSGSV